VTTASLRAQARGLDLGECVLFAGHAGSVAPWMRGSAVGVIPSLGSEAVSRVALEWMAQARPVVASSVGGMPELIESGRSGLLVPPGRADALAEAVLSLLADPPWLRLLGELARRSAETRFSTERLLRETARVYEEARCRG
jgi:glycosyltransferase involved in cell wall biosynthesis